MINCKSVMKIADKSFEYCVWLDQDTQEAFTVAQILILSLVYILHYSSWGNKALSDILSYGGREIHIDAVAFFLQLSSNSIPLCSIQEKNRCIVWESLCSKASERKLLKYNYNRTVVCTLPFTVEETTKSEINSTL